MDSGSFAAFVGQIVREHPAGIFKYIVSQTVVTVGRMLFVGFFQQLGK